MNIYIYTHTKPFIQVKSKKCTYPYAHNLFCDDHICKEELKLNLPTLLMFCLSVFPCSSRQLLLAVH